MYSFAELIGPVVAAGGLVLNAGGLVFVGRQYMPRG